MALPKFSLPNLKEPPARRKLLIYLLIVGAILIILSVSLLGVVNLPQFCILCHSQRPEYEAWKRSAHANIGCKSCHTPPGGALDFLVDEVIQTWVGMKEFVGYEKPINAHSEYSQKVEENAACLRCHSLETRQFTTRLDVIMDEKAHKKHAKKGLRCTTCHNRVTHKGAEKFEPLTKWKKGFRYKNFLLMKEGCFRCHSMNPRPEELASEIKKAAKRAPIACTLCHPEGWPFLPAGHGNDWREAHVPMAKGDLNSCLRCHPKKACNECHRREKIGLVLRERQ